MPTYRYTCDDVREFPSLAVGVDADGVELLESRTLSPGDVVDLGANPDPSRFDEVAPASTPPAAPEPSSAEVSPAP